MNKLRWGKFYWSDWSDDPALALCGLAAQGLWMRLLCIAAQGTPYGHINIKGRSPTVEELAKLVRARPYLVARYLAELERHGVLTTDASGTRVSCRMEADGKRANARASAANSRWHKGNGVNLHMQKKDFAYTEERREEAESPLNPPVNGGRRGAGHLNLLLKTKAASPTSASRISRAQSARFRCTYSSEANSHD